jgi:hypothetical protein
VGRDHIAARSRYTADGVPDFLVEGPEFAAIGVGGLAEGCCVRRRGLGEGALDRVHVQHRIGHILPGMRIVGARLHGRRCLYEAGLAAAGARETRGPVVKAPPVDEENAGAGHSPGIRGPGLKLMRVCVGLHEDGEFNVLAADPFGHVSQNGKSRHDPQLA